MKDLTAEHEVEGIVSRKEATLYRIIFMRAGFLSARRLFCLFVFLLALVPTVVFFKVDFSRDSI